MSMIPHFLLSRMKKSFILGSHLSAASSDFLHLDLCKNVKLGCS